MTFKSLSGALPGGIDKAFLHLWKSSLLVDGAYYEFGVYTGYSLYYAEKASKAIRGPEFMFYGFDSFRGLPEPRVDIMWAEGDYAVSREETESNLAGAGTDMSKVVLVEGFYSRGLFEEFWRGHQKTPALVLIDCDLFESCYEVLSFFGHKFVPGTVVMFDEFNGMEYGEKFALERFEKRFPLFKKRHLFSYGKFGEVFEVTHATSGDH